MSDSASSDDNVRTASTQARIITREKASPPLTIGPERLHYSFSVALPAVHLTFVSIVQGVVVGQLLSTLPLPSRAESSSVAALTTFTLDQHAYLAYLISGALILLIWKQFVQASLFYTWPLTITQIALILLIASAELVAFREIGHIFGWFMGVGLIGVIGGFIRLHNIPLRKEWNYEFAPGKQRDNFIELYSGLLYIALGAVILAFGLAEHYQWLSLGLDAQTVAWVALFALAVIVVVVIVLDHLAIKEYIDDALGPSTASDLERIDPAGIRYQSIKLAGGQKEKVEVLQVAESRNEQTASLDQRDL